jgi:butyryl-CoA dehydrogenase
MALVDYPLSSDDRALLASFRKLVRDEIAPRAKQVERDGVFPAHGYHKLATSGYLGLGHDETHGGVTVSPALSVLMQEQLGAACASTFLSSGASAGLFGLPLGKFGSEAQQKRWLPALLRGEVIGAFGLTEAHAGSDVAAMKTHARRDGTDWIINGEKMWITNAPCCDVAIIFAKTNPEAGYAGVSLFLIDQTTRGFTRGPALDKLGFRGSPTGALIMEDCRVPASSMVGEEGMGFMMAMATLEFGRIGMSALSVGIAQAAFESAVNYVRERQVFGKPLAKFQDVQFRLADLATELELARTMTIRAAETKHLQGEARTLASMAKLYASELANRATEVAMQLHGANGYSEDFPLARLHRDARLCAIGEGASAIQRTLIARSIFEE